MAEKNGFNNNKFTSSSHECHLGAVVKELLVHADKPGSTPGHAVLGFIVIPFFLGGGLCLLTLFFLLACFPLFLLLTPLITHLDQYIFQAQVRSLILEKGLQKLLIFILAKELTTRKKRSAVKTCPPLKQLKFFQC